MNLVGCLLESTSILSAATTHRFNSAVSSFKCDVVCELHGIMLCLHVSFFRAHQP